LVTPLITITPSSSAALVPVGDLSGVCTVGRPALFVDSGVLARRSALLARSVVIFS
jgi:hypothetical protein